MSLGDTLKRTGIAAGVTAGVGGVVYAGQRLLATRLRHREDPDADNPLVPAFDEAIRIDCHDAGSLYVISRGVGPPIVFSHGVTLSSRTWAKQFDSIPAAGFRALAFDGRGHGESTVGDTGHSIDNLAADVRSVLEALDLHDAVLVGHSMGGMAMQAFAIRHPDIALGAVSGLVLLSTSPRTVTSDARRLRGPLERVTGVGARTSARSCASEPRPADRAHRASVTIPHPSHVEATRQMLAACSRETLRDASRAHALARPHSPDLPSITLPDARDRRHRRRAHAAARLPPDRDLDSRRAPGGVPGRRSHAHVRTHRRSRPAHHRLRARSRAREPPMRSGRVAAQ